MKGYLFGLGAMLVGAGLMFVLMHGEVIAESDNLTKFTCNGEIIKMQGTDGKMPIAIANICTGHGLKCVFSTRIGVNNPSGVSCVKTGMFK